MENTAGCRGRVSSDWMVTGWWLDGGWMRAGGWMEVGWGWMEVGWLFGGAQNEFCDVFSELFPGAPLADRNFFLQKSIQRI